MRAKRSRFTLVRAGALCALAGLLTMAACEARVPTSAELSSMDVAGAEKVAASSGAFSAGNFANADYFLNGVKMWREELDTLQGERIASMTVVKGATGGRDTIFVVTRDAAEELGRVRGVGMKIRDTTTLSGRVALRTPRGGGPAPTIMIDGQISTESALAALREDDIVSVQITKPTKQLATGGDAYPNGLLVIETKIGARSPSKVRVRDKRSTAPSIREGADPSKGVPLTGSARTEPAFQIDGAPSTRAQFEALDSRDIVTVDVVKEKAVATALSHDPAAVNGLVRISTKRAKEQ